MARQLRLLTFRIGVETFAVDIMAVRQIVKPAKAEGMPVIDIRRRFVLKQNEYSELPLVLILESSAGRIGVKIDEIVAPIDVMSDDLVLPDSIVAGLRAEDLVATVEQDHTVIPVLDVDAIQSSVVSTAASGR